MKKTKFKINSIYLHTFYICIISEGFWMRNMESIAIECLLHLSDQLYTLSQASDKLLDNSDWMSATLIRSALHTVIRPR